MTRFVRTYLIREKKLKNSCNCIYAQRYDILTKPLLPPIQFDQKMDMRIPVWSEEPEPPSEKCIKKQQGS